MAVVAKEEKRVVMKTEVLVMSSGDNVVSSSSDDLLIQSATDDASSHSDHDSQTPGTTRSMLLTYVLSLAAHECRPQTKSKSRKYVCYEPHN